MMNVTTDVQSTTAETKEKRYKTLFGSALGYAAEGLDMLLLSFVLVYILKEFHLSPVEGGKLTLATTIGMLIGIATFGILADKIGRRKTFTIYYVGGTIYCLIYFFLFTGSTLLLWRSALLGFFANGMMGGFGAVLAENYPAEARSTAENFIFGTGRGLAGFGPVIIGLLATGGNLMGALSLIFIIYPIGLVTMLLCVPETKDKVLE